MRRTKHIQWTLEDVLPKIVVSHISDVYMEHAKKKPQNIPMLVQEVGETVLMFLTNSLMNIQESSQGLQKFDELLRKVVFDIIMKHEEQRLIAPKKKRNTAAIRRALRNIEDRIDKLPGDTTSLQGRVIKLEDIHKAKDIPIKKAVLEKTYMGPHKMMKIQQNFPTTVKRKNKSKPTKKVKK